MLKASIDIGSNSVLLLISEYIDGKYEDVESRSRITSLGRNLDTNKEFSQESMDATFQALKEFKKFIGKYDLKAENTMMTATEASRVATNANKFFDRVEKKLGFKVTILTPEGEAYYTARGVIAGASLQSSEVTIMDIGGASTELIKVSVKPFKILETISLPIGSVRASDWINEDCFQSNVEDIFDQNDLSSFKADKLLCVAGTMTAIGAMLLGLSSFKESSVNDSHIKFDKFCEYLEKIKLLSEDDLDTQYPFLGKRSKTIVAGARVARAMGLELEVSEFSISTLGLRYGTLLDDTILSEFTVN